MLYVFSTPNDIKLSIYRQIYCGIDMIYLFFLCQSDTSKHS